MVGGEEAAPGRWRNTDAVMTSRVGRQAGTADVPERGPLAAARAPSPAAGAQEASPKQSSALAWQGRQGPEVREGSPEDLGGSDSMTEGAPSLDCRLGLPRPEDSADSCPELRAPLATGHSLSPSRACGGLTPQKALASGCRTCWGGADPQQQRVRVEEGTWDVGARPQDSEADMLEGPLVVVCLLGEPGGRRTHLFGAPAPPRSSMVASPGEAGGDPTL